MARRDLTLLFDALRELLVSYRHETSSKREFRPNEISGLLRCKGRRVGLEPPPTDFFRSLLKVSLFRLVLFSIISTRPGDLYAIQDDLGFIKSQIARLPTRNEVWRAGMLGMLSGAVAAVTLIEAFSRSCL